MGKYGCRRFVNFTFFPLHILTLQVIFPEKIIELSTIWYIHWHGLMKQKFHLHMMNMMQSKKCFLIHQVEMSPC